MYSLLSKRSLDNLGYFDIDIYSTKIIRTYHYTSNMTIINVINDVWNGTYPIIGKCIDNKNICLFDTGKKLSICVECWCNYISDIRNFTLFNYLHLDGKFKIKYSSDESKLKGHFKLGNPVMPWIAMFNNEIHMYVNKVKFSPRFVETYLDLADSVISFHLTKLEWKMHPTSKLRKNQYY